MSTLREAIEQKKRENPAPEVCVDTGAEAYIDFWPTPLERVGFGTGQLLRYRLATRKPDLADDPTKPPQTLTLSFPTDDVVITGKRLEDICSLLGKNDLKAVRALSERFAELRPTSPFVAKIEIRPVKGGDEV